MEDLKQQFKKETDLSFDDIPINGIHLEYINWLEKRIEALSISNVVGQSGQLGSFRCPPWERCKNICEECAMVNGIDRA